MAGAAGAALLVGWLQPAAWLLALLLAAILATVWLFAVVRLVQDRDVDGDRRVGAGDGAAGCGLTRQVGTYGGCTWHTGRSIRTSVALPATCLR